MTQFNEFLNLLSEAKKESEQKETVLTEKIKNNSFFDLLMNVEISNEQLDEEIEQVYQETDSQTVESILETVIGATKEQIVEKIIETNPLLEASTYDKLFKTNVNLFDQPDLPKTTPEIKALTDKIQYMENWLTKISMAGPGGGEVNLRYLDDVDRSSIANDRYLKYDQGTNKFVFSNPTGAEVGVLDYLQLNTAGPGETVFPGTLYWNPTEDCLNEIGRAHV